MRPYLTERAIGSARLQSCASSALRICRSAGRHSRAHHIHLNELPSTLSAVLSLVAEPGKKAGAASININKTRPCTMPIRRASKCVLCRRRLIHCSACSRGKKRAIEDVLSDHEHMSDASSTSTVDAPMSARAQGKQPAAIPVKKRAFLTLRFCAAVSMCGFLVAKRAETRKCPVCDEPIPIRLLGKHADLEWERLEEIIRCIGSTEVLGEAEPDDGCVHDMPLLHGTSYNIVISPRLTARTRRSALKARQHLKPGSSSTSEATLEQTMKTLRALKKHRKQRHAKLREMAREGEDEDGPWWGGKHRADAEEGDGMVCPVCSKFVRGDVDVVEAHVDSCLAYENIRQEEEEGRRRSAGVDIDGDVDVDGEGLAFGVMEGVSFRGASLRMRRSLQWGLRGCRDRFRHTQSAGPGCGR